jgi:hypothetical protein
MKAFVFSLVVLIVLSLPYPSRSQLKGGGFGNSIPSPIMPRYEHTLYFDPIEEWIEIVTKYKDISMKNRAIIISKKPLRNIAFGWVASKKISDISYKLSGTTSNGDEVSIDLSMIEYIRKVDIQENSSMFEVTIFPNISPKVLLQQKPTYNDLRKNFVDKVNIWVKHKKKGGGNFSLIAISDTLKTDSVNIKNYDSIGKIEDLSINYTYEIGYNDTKDEQNNKIFPIWWAITPVSYSKGYPYCIGRYANSYGIGPTIFFKGRHYGGDGIDEQCSGYPGQ